MAKKQTAFRNRLISVGTEDPETLLANPLNWRIHPKNQQAALESVLDSVGWVDTVIVNQRTGYVVDGHLRVALALRRGEKSVPVQYVDLDENEERLILATLDPIAAMAVNDEKQFRSLLQSIRTDATTEDLLKRISEAEGVDLPPDEFPPVSATDPETPGEAAAYATCPQCGHRFLHG